MDNIQQQQKPDQRRQFGGRKDFRKAPASANKEKVLDLRRVTRVMAGGKRFKFRATIVVGDEKGKIGIGVAKGVDVAQAVNKAKTKATKHMFLVHLKEGHTIAHEVYAKYSAAKILIKPARPGHGLRAGGAVRSVLALAGIKDATAKCLGRTPNKLTNAWATIEALAQLKKPRENNRTNKVATTPSVEPAMTSS
jgi:small subunit ribosomal protein S5